MADSCPIRQALLLLEAVPALGLQELRRAAVEALDDVIEFAPQQLLRHTLQPACMQLAAAAAERAAAATTVATVASAHDLCHLVASCAAAQLGDVAEAVMGPGAGPTAPPMASCASGPSGGVGLHSAGVCGTQGSGTALSEGQVEACSAEAQRCMQLAGALAGLAGLRPLTAQGQPVGWPATLALSDLALACLAHAPPPMAAAESCGFTLASSLCSAGGTGVTRGSGMAGCDADAMQAEADGATGHEHLDGGGAGGGGGGGEAGGGGFTFLAGAAAEHCVPDITVVQRPGVPAAVVQLYDSVLHAVLSCCVTWAGQAGGGGGGGDGWAGLEGGDEGGGGGGGLLRLPPDAREALRGCLEACAGVLGQRRQLQVAAHLAQLAAEADLADPAACGGDTGTAGGGGAPSHGGARGAVTEVRRHALLCASLAAVAACGRLPVPPAQAAAMHTEVAVCATTDAASLAASVLSLASAAVTRSNTLQTGHSPVVGSGGDCSIGAGGGAACAGSSAPQWLLGPLLQHYSEACVGCAPAVLRHVRCHAEQQLASTAHGETAGLPSAAGMEAVCSAVAVMVGAALTGVHVWLARHGFVFNKVKMFNLQDCERAEAGLGFVLKQVVAAHRFAVRLVLAAGTARHGTAAGTVPEVLMPSCNSRQYPAIQLV